MVGNAVFILTSDVVNRAATFILYALIARYRGAVEVGQLALGLTLFYAFQVFATAGLKTIVTREVAKDRSRLDHYLGVGSILVTFASALSISFLAGFVHLMGYARETAAVVLLLGFGLLPCVLSTVCEAIFQASDRTRYIAFAQVPVSVAKVGLAYLLLSEGYGIYHLTLLLLACQSAVATVEWWLMLRYVGRPRLRAAERGTQGSIGLAASSFTMARSAGTFLGIDGLIAINASLNVLLLSALAGETEVGLYSAASQLMVPVMLISQSAVLAVFPTICRRFDTSVSDALKVLERVVVLLLALAVPAAVGLFFLADAALLLLYGDRDFLLAAVPLRIMVWNLIPVALTAVLGQVFLASVREKVTLRIVAVDTVVGLLAGAVLITKLGLLGAAIAAVLTKAVDFLQHYRSASRLVPAPIRLHELSWKPVVAGACMAVYLAVAQSQGFVLTVVCSGALYVGVLSALIVWTTGTPQQLRARSLLDRLS